MLQNLRIAKHIWLPAIAIGLLVSSCSSKYEGYSRKNGIYYKLITIGDTVNPPHAGDYVTTQLRYATDRRRIVKAGIGFSVEKRAMTGYIIED